MLEDRELDLAQREADLALRMRAPVQADLIQRKLFTVHYHIYASPDYIARQGAPQTVDDLVNHTLIVYGETAAPEIRDVNWLLDTTRRMAPAGCTRALRINNITGISQATEAGAGISALPDFMAHSVRGSCDLCPMSKVPVFDAHLVYCDALRQSKRVGAFRDFLVRTARDWRF